MSKSNLYDRTYRLKVSTQPLCVLFPKYDFTEVVGYVYYGNQPIRLRLRNLIGYVGDDTYYCERILSDLDAKIQTQLLYDAFTKPIIFEYAYIYKDFVRSVKRLIIEGRLAKMTKESRKYYGC